MNRLLEAQKHHEPKEYELQLNKSIRTKNTLYSHLWPLLADKFAPQIPKYRVVKLSFWKPVSNVHFFSQLYYMFVQVSLQAMHDGVQSIKLLLLPFVTAISLGALYHNNDFEDIPSNVYMVSFALSFIATQDAIRYLGDNMDMIIREGKAGVSPLVIYFVRDLYGSIMNLVLACTFLTMLLLFENRGTYGDFFLLVWLLSFTNCGFGFFISSIAKDRMAVLLAAVLPLILGLLGGFNPTKCDMPEEVSWIFDLSYVRWGFEAFIIQETRELSEVYRQPTEQMMAQFGFKPTNYALDIRNLLFFAFGARILAFLIFKYKFITEDQALHRYKTSFFQLFQAKKNKPNGKSSSSQV